MAPAVDGVLLLQGVERALTEELAEVLAKVGPLGPGVGVDGCGHLRGHLVFPQRPHPGCGEVGVYAHAHCLDGIHESLLLLGPYVASSQRLRDLHHCEGHDGSKLSLGLGASAALLPGKREEGCGPDGLEEAQVVRHALVEVYVDGHPVLVRDVQEEAAAEKAVEEARGHVGKLRLVGQALREGAVGAVGEQDLAHGPADVVAKVLVVFVLVVRECGGQLLHDVGPVRHHTAADVLGAAEVPTRLLERVQGVALHALVHHVVQESDHVLEAHAQLHDGGRGSRSVQARATAASHQASAHAAHHHASAPHHLKSPRLLQAGQSPTLVEEVQRLLGLGGLLRLLRLPLLLLVLQGLPLRRLLGLGLRPAVVARTSDSAGWNR
mmetsp:Transcript_61986/g.184619  ORF Transcript_61986/g.184619 Transcript_61986/m.184619 type:complete len:380 (-) Transcript_61986:109-1248(-)